MGKESRKNGGRRGCVLQGICGLTWCVFPGSYAFAILFCIQKYINIW
jgi:hypothetical protein